MIPNMSNTILRFARTITKRDVSQVNVDGEAQDIFIDGDIKATITTPKPEELQQLEVNSKLKYKVCHSVDEITINDRFITSDNPLEYKVIAEQERDLYGYYRVVGEEVQ